MHLPSHASHTGLTLGAMGRLVSGCLALLLSSCGGDGTTNSGGEHSFEHVPERYRALAETVHAQQERWASNGFSTYKYTYQRSCFCVPDWTRPVVIDVKDNRIGRIVYADDEVPVGPTYWKSYHTVDELFALIDSALVRDAAQVTVQFDEALGYPTQLYIDEDLRIADEELGITASDVRSQP